MVEMKSRMDAIGGRIDLNLLVPARYSAKACRRMSAEEPRKSADIAPATSRSGQAVPVPNTPSAAAITATLLINHWVESQRLQRQFPVARHCCVDGQFHQSRFSPA